MTTTTKTGAIQVKVTGSIMEGFVTPAGARRIKTRKHWFCELARFLLKEGYDITEFYGMPLTPKQFRDLDKKGKNPSKPEDLLMVVYKDGASMTFEAASRVTDTKRKVRVSVSGWNKIKDMKVRALPAYVLAALEIQTTYFLTCLRKGQRKVGSDEWIAKDRGSFKYIGSPAWKEAFKTIKNMD